MAYDTQAIVNASLGGETVSYGRVGTVSTTSITAVRHGQDVTEGLTSYGVYAIERDVWTFATDALAFTPKMRDTITPSDSLARPITKVGGSTWLKFYRVETSYPSLASDLDGVATVYRPAPTPDSIGLRVANLATVYTSQAVRLQPAERAFEPDIAGKSLTTRANYVCIFGSSVTLNAGDVIEVSSVKYEVTGQSEVESLGVLTFASCTRIS